jgi:Na+/H+ antiporter NhaD/arsenite permease-like protein
MAMVSLTIATLLKGQDDWELWYYMFIPLAIMIIATILVLYFNYAQREDFEVDTEPEEPPAPAPKPQPVVETPMEPVPKTAEPDAEQL